MTLVPSTRSRLALGLGLATALMCSLAGGAVWCVLALYLRRDATALACLVALVVAWVLRAHGYARTAFGAACAALATALACVYAQYLLAAADVALTLGLPLRNALTQIGPQLALAVAWARVDAWQIAVFAFAIALSAALVWGRARD